MKASLERTHTHTHTDQGTFFRNLAAGEILASVQTYGAAAGSFSLQVFGVKECLL